MGEERLFIVNESGDILQEVGTDYDRLINNTIIIKPSVEYKEVIKLDYPYVKVNVDVTKTLYDECQQAFLFFDLLEYKTNFLMYSNGKYVNQTGFAKYAGISREYASVIFNKCKKLDIIKPVKVSRRIVYMFNPYIAMRGSYIYKELMEHFKDTKWEKMTRPRRKKGK